MKNMLLIIIKTETVSEELDYCRVTNHKFEKKTAYFYMFGDIFLTMVLMSLK